MILNIILLITGFIILIKGADFFVDGASSTAENFKMSKTLIGLTIVAFGTSAPEFAVSMQAIATHHADMVLGNVIGSCIMNVLLIIGLAAAINPIRIKDHTVKKELPLALLLSTLLVTLMLDIEINHEAINQVTRSDAIVIILFFTIFVYYLVSLVKQKKETPNKEPKYKIHKSIILVIIGLVGIILGSELVVNNAADIAELLGFSERVISLTIIAFGTSLPEIVTTIISSKKGEQDLLLGNIIGSNIFNICVVLGIPVAIFGTITPEGYNSMDLIMLIVSTMLLFIFCKSNKKITRLEGILMLLTFLAYYTYIVIVV